MLVLQYIGVCTGIILFVLYVFDYADKVAKKEAKESARQFLRNLEIGKSIFEWPQRFCQLFDAVFGERHLSLKCFLRSTVASICTVILITFMTSGLSLIYLGFQKKIFGEFLLLTYLGFILTVNILADYLSLLETRWILKLIKSHTSLSKIILLLIADILLTIAIYSILIFFSATFRFIPLFSIIDYIKYGEIPFISHALGFYYLKEILIEGILFKNFFGVFFYSTFFTTIWAWLYFFASISVAGLSKIHRLWFWLRNTFLDIDLKPILAIGWISILILAVIFLLYFPLVIFYNSDYNGLKNSNYLEEKLDEPFDANIYGVLVGPFLGGSKSLNEKGIEFQHSLAATLRARFYEIGASEVVVKEVEFDNKIKIDEHKDARLVGKKYNAELVIWGDATISGIIPNITVVKENSYSALLTRCCGNITIFEDSLTHNALQKMNDIRMPIVVKEPTIIVAFIMGVKHFDRQEYKKALKYLKMAIPKNALTFGDSSTKYFDISQILTVMGLTYYKLSEIDNAINVLERALKVSPDNIIAGILLSIFYFDSGNQEKANDVFLKTMLSNLSREKKYFSDLYTHICDKNYDLALKEINKELKNVNVKKENELNYLLRGIIFYKKDDYSNAINDFNEVIYLAPKNHIAYMHRAYSYYNSGNFSKVIEDLNIYFILVPEPGSEIYRYRGCAYKHIGENEKALKDLNRAIELDSTNYMARLFRGMIYSEKREIQAAIDDFESAVSINDKNPHPYMYLALLYEYTMDYGKALLAYKKILESDQKQLSEDEIINVKERINFLEVRRVGR